MKIQESFLPSFPFFHLLLHWVRQPFLGVLGTCIQYSLLGNGCCSYVYFIFISVHLGICDKALFELSNPGASGSLFYVSSNDEFIIKTVQKKETEFLQKLLPGYYLVRGNCID